MCNDSHAGCFLSFFTSSLGTQFPYCIHLATFCKEWKGSTAEFRSYSCFSRSSYQQSNKFNSSWMPLAHIFNFRAQSTARSQNSSWHWKTCYRGTNRAVSCTRELQWNDTMWVYSGYISRKTSSDCTGMEHLWAVDTTSCDAQSRERSRDSHVYGYASLCSAGRCLPSGT